MLKKNEKITKELLLIWHKSIFGETKSDIAGRFRDYLVRVGPHLAPDWQDVKKLMEGFIRFVNQTEINPVTGEKQHVALSPDQEIRLGLESALGRKNNLPPRLSMDRRGLVFESFQV